MMAEFLVFGVVVGLAAGLSPGPLTALVFSETLKRGRKEGIQVAISPLVSESPMILIVLVLLSWLAGNQFVIGLISMLGACFLAYLGFSNLVTEAVESQQPTRKGNSLLKGIVTNLLNPNAYIFWLTVGGPKIIEGIQIHVSATILFLLGFYMMLIGSKTAIALIVDRSRTLVSRKHYIHIIRFLGIILIGFALILLRNTIYYLGIS